MTVNGKISIVYPMQNLLDTYVLKLHIIFKPIRSLFKIISGGNTMENTTLKSTVTVSV